MESECNFSRRRYDITMSKRTRKPSMMDEAPAKGSEREREEENSIPGIDEREWKDRKSLEDLINKEEKGIVSNSSDEKVRRNSLDQHFHEEEKQLQMVVRPPREEGGDGVKLKGMVSRYMKVLSHMIKVKHLGPRKKQHLRLTI